ncbi:DUF4352 domain-containing protein [Haladaptatus sp.]|uniref:DUF4352 domain-containing protein n=1 Tax=Haladaptatus sp. TaxID=1973141 RepID=UPI003C3E812E
MKKRAHVGRRTFITASAVTALAGCTSQGSDTTDAGTSSSSTSTESSTSSPGTNENGDTERRRTETIVSVGSVVKDDTLAMVVREVTTEDKLSEFRDAEEGKTFAVIRMAVKNRGTEFIDFEDFLDASVVDGENQTYDPSVSSPDHPIRSGVLAPGEVVRGDMVFEVPKGTHGLSLRLDFESFTSFRFKQVTVSLGKKADSIADLKQSLDDVLSSGEKASRGSVSVIVHGVRTTKQLNEITDAADGHEFVVPDIEITNGGDERLLVSTLLQMHVKTGAGLAYTADIGASSGLKQPLNESSDIESGESHRGELAYQVETGTKPLYWAFNFLEADEPYKGFWKLR